MNDLLPQPTRRWPPGEWLGGLSTLTAACLVSWLLCDYAAAPVWAAFILSSAVAWVMYRFVRASTRGVILWYAAALSVLAWMSLPDGPDEVVWACAVIGLLLALASSSAFLVAAVKNRGREAANCNGCALALSTLIGWIVIGGTIRGELRRHEEIQRTTHMLVAVHELAHDADAIRARLGRSPADEKEFVRLRGEPMPCSMPAEYLAYFHNSEFDYQFNFGLRNFWGDHWDLFGYVAVYYGPSASPRLRVFLF